jgi:3-hydroxybutyrate dehydrogenase
MLLATINVSDTLARAVSVLAGSLAGRTAIVTGSTSGIGLGIARCLASSGANIMLNGFGDAKAIAQLQKELAAEFKDIKIAYSPADMASAEQIHTMVNDTVSKLGSLDILINNAGIQHVSPVDTFPANQWDRIIAINLTSAFHTIQASLPHMKKSGNGRIINIASVHGLVGSAGKSAYVASKHGVIGLTKVVALENANTGVTCNAIAPGWVLTPLVQQQIDARAAAAGVTVKQAKDTLLGEKQPMLEFSTTDGLGALAVFLCTPEAKTITGTTMTMDGGWTAQ